MAKTPSKVLKAQRLVTIIEARMAARDGRHDDARALFAGLGISYNHTPTN